MRKLLVILIATALARTSAAQSQDTTGPVFKKFKVDVSGGYASPSNSSPGSNFSGGALFAIEPKFAVIDPLAIGVRVEAAVTAHINNNNNNNNNNYNSNKSSGKANLSYLLTADYYFTKTSFRPFIGAGGGIYSTATLDSTTVNSNSGSIPYNSQSGFMLRAGFELSHLRVGVEYNFVSNNASYLGLKIGVCIGGGRIRK